MTHFEQLSNLQNWLASCRNAVGNLEVKANCNQLYTDKRQQIFPLVERACAIEQYYSLKYDFRNGNKSLRNAFEKQHLELLEFFRGLFKKRNQGEFEKVTEILTELKFLAKKADLIVRQLENILLCKLS